MVCILACLVIAGSAIGTSAACGRKVVYDYGYGNSCGDNACGQAQRPQDCGSLCELLRKLGCDEQSCRNLYSLLNRCSNGCDSGTEAPGCEDGSCENAPEPTEPEAVPTEEPAADTPEQEPVQQPTDEPEQTQEPVEPAPTQEPTQASAEPQGYALNAYEKEVVALINQIRAQNGLGSLKINTELSRVARIKSQDMHDKGYFSHTSPTYGSPFDMMKSFGIRYRTAGENIAMGYRTPQSVVDGWMNSEGHRKNILNPGFSQIGMGYVESGNYWTQMFIG